MDRETLIKARALLENVTPLRTDCGLLCSHVCCTDPDGDDAGMLLFPGEDALVEGAGRIREEDGRKVFVCDGRCERTVRPFACRIFPLSPVKDAEGRWIVKTDRRAHAMCPLAAHGLHGMDRAFVNACVRAVRLIVSDPDGERFLNEWAENEESLADLFDR